MLLSSRRGVGPMGRRQDDIHYLYPPPLMASGSTPPRRVEPTPRRGGDKGLPAIVPPFRRGSGEAGGGGWKEGYHPHPVSSTGQAQSSPVKVEEVVLKGAK
jgi:hypothetical protein